MTEKSNQHVVMNRITSVLSHYPVRYLIADDGSQDILSAVDMLHSLPLHDCTITAIAVLSSHEAGSYAVRQADLEQIQKRFSDKNIHFNIRLEGGDPAGKILEYAHEHNPALIVMGATGLRHVAGIMLGGVAERVVENSHTPVLVMRHPFHSMQHVLLLTDGSSQSLYATQYIADFPLPSECRITVLHVESPPTYDEAIASSWETPGKASTAVGVKEATGQAILDKSIALIKANHRSAEGVLLYGEPCEEIRSFINHNHVDLVFAGARGLTKGKMWEIGSLSRKLLHYCSCPLTIVKDRRDWSTRN